MSLQVLSLGFTGLYTLKKHTVSFQTRLDLLFPAKYEISVLHLSMYPEEVHVQVLQRFNCVSTVAIITLGKLTSFLSQLWIIFVILSLCDQPPLSF